MPTKMSTERLPGARALEHQEDEEHEHHELASTRATTNARTRTRDEEGGMKGLR